MATQLRTYQLNAKKGVSDLFRQGVKKVLVAMGTGSGKTTFIADIIKDTIAKDNRVIFLAHRDELIDNARDRLFDQMNIRAGVIKSGRKSDPSKMVQVASVQTLIGKLKTGNVPAKLIVVDECHHHSNDGTYAKIMEYYKNSFVIGLTATPFRLDGKPLDFYQRILHPVKMKELIEQGFLVPCKVYAPKKGSINLEDLKKRAGDYNISDTAQRFDDEVIQSTIEYYKDIGKGKSFVAFCQNVKNSKIACNAFNKAGIVSAHIDANTKDKRRKEIVQMFREGKIQILFNVNIFTEGFDMPSIWGVILLRKTASLGLYLQMLGRGMRPQKGKTECTVIDMANNISEHGYPRNYDDWGFTLSGLDKKPSKPKLCEQCNEGVAELVFEDDDFRYYKCGVCEAPSKRSKNTKMSINGSKELVVANEVSVLLTTLLKQTRQTMLKHLKAKTYPLKFLRIQCHLKGYKRKYPGMLFLKHQLGPEGFNYDHPKKFLNANALIAMAEEEAGLSKIWMAIREIDIPKKELSSKDKFFKNKWKQKFKNGRQ